MTAKWSALKKISSLAAVCMMFSIVMVTDADKSSAMTEDEVYEMAVEIGELYNICPEFLVSIAYQESRYDPDAKNGGCKGLLQISERWHKDRMERLGVTDIYDPYGNMLVAADYLAELFERWEDVGMVLMTYNGDSNARKYWNGEVDLSEYASEILERSAEMERAHGK